MDSINLELSDQQNIKAILSSYQPLPLQFGTPSKDATSTVNARVLIEYNGQFLYLRKNEDRGGKLSLPGGNIEKKELVRKGLRREIKEEVNLAIKKKRLQPIHTLFHKKKKVSEVTFFFLVMVEDLTMLHLNEPEKFSQLVWVDTTIIPKDLSRPLKFALKQFKKGRFFSEYTRKKKRKSSIQVEEECTKNRHSVVHTNII